uniref:Uncharacterized protein n=1 Tax=Octactis speculum TaxID=3111310 RepID=A0A7S2B7J7_9STRA
MSTPVDRYRRSMHDCLNDGAGPDVWQSSQNLEQERTMRAHTSHGHRVVNESRARRVKDSFLSDSSPFVVDLQKRFESEMNQRKSQTVAVEKIDAVPHTSFFRKKSNIFGEEDQRLQSQRQRQNLTHNPHSSDRMKTDVNLLSHYPRLMAARSHYNTAAPMYSQRMCVKAQSDLSMDQDSLKRPGTVHTDGQWKTGRVKQLGSSYFAEAFRNK